VKRSEVNAIMQQSAAFLQQMRFALPPFAYWPVDEWQRKGPECREIAANQLGWDITDFGCDDFGRVGLVLFTLRNGTLAGLPAGGKVYAEKALIVREGQKTPTHFHFHKMEDIINRAGGTLVIKLWNSTADGELADTNVVVKVDGAEMTVPAGGTVALKTGESICLPQRLYHTFWAEQGQGAVLVGEVSSVNDDHVDNRFNPTVGRFSVIDEDVAPLYLLQGDYARYYRY